jgi:2-methylisocitrate lyase-like PEP mutase family enzyme
MENGKFRALHEGPAVLLLPNAWDAASARLMEARGARAVATTSAGVAWSLGYPDGDKLPVDKLVAAVAGMVRVLRVPLSVDVEGGYSDEPARVGQTVAALLEVGAVGVNLEDGAGPPELLCAKIAEVKRAAARLGLDLFVNARTDVWLRELVAPHERVQQTLARARMYREAGADGLFVPKLVEPADISVLVQESGLPLNLLLWPGLPVHAELQRLGVRRLSAGSALAQLAWGRVAQATERLLVGESLLADGVPYAELNGLFSTF